MLVFALSEKRKRDVLGRLSVFAWLLCRCRLSVRLCLLWCFCLAVFRCFCCVCVCVCGRRLCCGSACCCCTVVRGPFCVSFLPRPGFGDLGGWFHIRVPLVHVTSCHVFHAHPALVLAGKVFVCVCVSVYG